MRYVTAVLSNSQLWHVSFNGSLKSTQNLWSCVVTQVYVSCVMCPSHRAPVHLLVQVELPPRPLYLRGRVHCSETDRRVRPTRLSAHLPERQRTRVPGYLPGHGGGGHLELVSCCSLLSQYVLGDDGLVRCLWFLFSYLSLFLLFLHRLSPVLAITRSLSTPLPI